MGFFKPNVARMEAKKDVRGLMKVVLESRDLDIIVNAIGALGEIRDSRAVGLLIQALQVDNEHVRAAAAMALINIRDSKAMEPLIQIMKNEGRKDVRELAAAVLTGMVWLPRNDTEKAWYLAARNDWKKLIEIGEPAVEPLIHALHFSDVNVRLETIRALVQIGDANAIEPLTHVLKYDNETKVREAAAIALGKIGDSRAVEPLVHALVQEGNDFITPFAAARALDEMKWVPKNDSEKQWYRLAKMG